MRGRQSENINFKPPYAALRTQKTEEFKHGIRLHSQLYADEVFLMLCPTRQESGHFIIQLTKLPTLFFAVYYTYLQLNFRSSCKMVRFVMHRYAKNWNFCECLHEYKISTQYVSLFRGNMEKSNCGLM
jgi:hypothetical protein